LSQTVHNRKNGSAAVCDGSMIDLPTHDYIIQPIVNYCSPCLPIKGPQTVLRCILFNSRSLKNKLDALHFLIYSGVYKLICVVESWLNYNITDCRLDPQGIYDIFRFNLPSPWGGVCVLILKSVCAVRILLHDKYRCLDCVMFEICNSIPKLRLLVIYRSGTGETTAVLISNT